MSKLVFGMMQSLDGYVDGVTDQLDFPPPDGALARHFNDRIHSLGGSLYGRRMYEIMRYWDEDRPEWDAGDHDFAAAWPTLAASLTALGLIDEYRLYLRPLVLGAGKPFFAGPRPVLRIVSNDRIGEDTVRLTCVPA